MSAVDFCNAKVGEEAWVYTCPDGWDEFAWTSHAETFDDIDEALTVVRRRWLLVEEQTVVFHPATELCPLCHGDGVDRSLYFGDDRECSLCKGDGGHPLAGQMEVTP